MSLQRLYHALSAGLNRLHADMEKEPVDSGVVLDRLLDLLAIGEQLYKTDNNPLDDVVHHRHDFPN